MRVGAVSKSTILFSDKYDVTDRDMPASITYTRNNYEDQTYSAAETRVGAASSNRNNVANGERFILVQLF